MAKSTLATMKKPSTEVAETTGGPPAALAEYARKTAGLGTSKDQADNLVPLVYILQSNSPQAIKRNPAYMENAEPGNIWLRSAPDPLVDGEEGILFQPCFFNKCVIEWIHRDDGGGFVARHEKMPGDAVRIEDPKNPNKVGWRSKKNNHQYVETREHVGYVIQKGKPPMPYVIPMTGSNHKCSREWMFMMNQKIIEGTGETYGSFCFMYRLNTIFSKNTQGEWFRWAVKDAGWVQTPEDIARGKALHDAFKSGAKQADAAGYADHEADEGDGDDNDDDAP